MTEGTNRIDAVTAGEILGEIALLGGDGRTPVFFRYPEEGRRHATLPRISPEGMVFDLPEDPRVDQLDDLERHAEDLAEGKASLQNRVLELKELLELREDYIAELEEKLEGWELL